LWPTAASRGIRSFQHRSLSPGRGDIRLSACPSPSLILQMPPLRGWERKFQRANCNPTAAAVDYTLAPLTGLPSWSRHTSLLQRTASLPSLFRVFLEQDDNRSGIPFRRSPSVAATNCPPDFLSLDKPEPVGYNYIPLRCRTRRVAASASRRAPGGHATPLPGAEREPGCPLRNEQPEEAVPKPKVVGKFERVRLLTSPTFGFRLLNSQKRGNKARMYMKTKERCQNQPLRHLLIQGRKPCPRAQMRMGLER